MADTNLTEKPLLEKIQDLLERKPGTCDVAFCVGKEMKIVRALKVILKASSPFLEKEFEENWEVNMVKEGDGIPLPDFDSVAFELFIKLTSLDTWSLEILKKLNLPPTQIFNLLSICRRFEMTKPVGMLQELAATVMQSFGDYKDTHDFLQLSQTNLKYVLGSDDIEINELNVFHAATRWAKFQCKEMTIEPTNKHIREVLGASLFEIRFPVMTYAEFTEARGSKDIFTAEETIGIYGFIGLADCKKLEFDNKKLPFKTAQRKQIQKLKSKPNSKKTNKIEALLPLGMSNISSMRNSLMVTNLKVVCDGSKQFHLIAYEDTTRVSGLGFLGPIESDGLYDVKVQVQGIDPKYDSGTLEKRIFVEKGKMFYFVFDQPINLDVINGGKYIRSYHYLSCSTFTKVP